MTPASSLGNFLALDGARRDAQWGVSVNGAVSGGRIRDRGAAEQLAPAVRAAIDGVRLDAIFVGNGPGSFAGLRIVLAFAKGLAKGLSVPLVAVPSLEAMLHEGVHADVALLNAFSGQVFSTYGVVTPEQLKSTLAGKRAVIDGEVPGIETFGLASWVDLRAGGHDVPRGVLRLGEAAWRDGRVANVDTLTPDYGRASTAELRQNKLL